MRILHSLEIDGAALEVIGAEVALALSETGRAVFTVRGAASGAVGKLARYRQGHAGRRVYPVFLGVVTAARAADGASTRLICRGLAMVLEGKAALALRHCTPADVLREMEAATGLAFLLPTSGEYLNTRLPYFAARGSWRAALEQMGAAWGVADALWLPMPDGRIFWGSWAGGPFSADPVPLDSLPMLTRHPELGDIELPALASMRPGVQVWDGGRFLASRVTFSGDRMRLALEAVGDAA